MFEQSTFTLLVAAAIIVQLIWLRYFSENVQTNKHRINQKKKYTLYHVNYDADPTFSEKENQISIDRYNNTSVLVKKKKQFVELGQQDYNRIRRRLKNQRN